MLCLTRLRRLEYLHTSELISYGERLCVLQSVLLCDGAAASMAGRYTDDKVRGTNDDAQISKL